MRILMSFLPGRLTVVSVFLWCAGVGLLAAEQRTIVAGFTEFPPYMFTDEDGRATGYSIELLRDGAAANGYPIEFRRFENVGALTNELAQGGIDATVLLGITSARKELGQFTDPVGNFSFELMFRDAAPRRALQGDLRGLRVAVNKGSAPHRLLAEREGVEFFFSSSIAERLFALITGSVDAVAGTPSVFRSAAKDVGLAAHMAAETYVIAELPRAFLISDDRPGFVAAMNTYIRGLKETGQLEAYEQEWLARLKPDLVDRLGANVLTVLGTALCAILLLAAGLAFIVLKRRIDLGEQCRTQSMVEALDAAQAGIAVFGPTGHLSVSNTAFDRAFPDLQSEIQSNAHAQELIGAALKHGYLGDGEQGAAAAQSLWDLVEDGASQAAEAIIYGHDRKVFACLACRLTDGRLAFIITDVSELEDGHRAMEAQAAELKAVNQHLETFARVAAHDLKAPAASTATLLDWIADDLNDAGIDMPDTVAEALDRARSLLERQVALIEDLLAYARTANSASTAQVIRPHERLNAILALIELPDGFTIESDKDLPSVVADPAAFDLVVRNLVSNSIKHHDRQEGRIVFRAEAVDEGTVALIVEDDGPGISDVYVDRVFEPFFRMGNQTGAAGSGLGLSVIQNAIHAWGGEVSIQPASPRGTAVRFTARRATTSPAADTRATPAQDDNASEKGAAA